MRNKDYKRYKNCRFCHSKNVEKVIDLGIVPLAGGFLTNKNQFKIEKKYPLQLNFCKDCFLLQVNISINPNILFKNYFYFSSNIKTLVDHFKKNAKDFSKMFRTEKIFVVEIGSNDGSFLEAMKKQGHDVLGIDPAENVAPLAIKKGVPMIVDYFNEKIAMKIVKKFGKADLIFSSNTLAHIEDMRSVFEGIRYLLSSKGILVFEVHYLPDLIKKVQYDMIYHEHQYYYSLHTLQIFLDKFDLFIYDAKKIPIHQGSIQVYVKKSKGTQNKRLINLIKQEKLDKINKTQTYRLFNKKIQQAKDQLLQFIKQIISNNKSIAGYGASGRGTIISNFCNLTKEKVSYVVDDSLVKIGAYMPGTHQEIVSAKILRSEERPDYTILFAWSFSKEILTKNKQYLKSGGKFIVPLSKVKVISK